MLYNYKCNIIFTSKPLENLSKTEAYRCIVQYGVHSSQYRELECAEETYYGVVRECQYGHHTSVL